MPNYIPVIYQPARIRWEQTAVSGVIINTIATALPVCMQKALNCKRARELTLSRYTKRQITEQLIVQSHGSIYGVGP